MTAREVLDELERWSRDGWDLSSMKARHVHECWVAKVSELRRQIEAEGSAWDHPAPTVQPIPDVTLSSPNDFGGLAAMNGVRLPDSEPSALEVALRLVECGKVAAVPRQAAAFACDLIECIRARQSKEAGK